jgi:glutamate-1-semialdehyde 2,1-aminomutase
MRVKTGKSKALFERARNLMPGGVNSPVRAFLPYPFFTSHAQGSKIFDVDGNEYIDYCLAYGPLILGHCHPRIISAVEQQLKKGTLYGTPTEAELKLAELICKNVPSIEMVRLVNTGTEATMSAIRAARGFTKKEKIIKFEGCYHGAHDSVLVKAGSGATTFGAPSSLGVPEEAAKNTLVIPYNDTEALRLAIRENENIAAVIIEPVIGNIGVVPPRKGFLGEVREFTLERDIVLIFDEVITGFRLAFGGAQEYYGIKPDMTTLGKTMGGGFPIAAYGGRKDIMQMISPSGGVYQAGTFSGNPISVIAGLAALETMHKKGERFYQELETKTRTIVDAAEKLKEENNVPIQVNCVASMFQIFFGKQPVVDYVSAKLCDAQKYMMFHRKLLEEQIYLPPSQFETCFLSISHSKNDIKQTLGAFESALGALS